MFGKRPKSRTITGGCFGPGDSVHDSPGNNGPRRGAGLRPRRGRGAAPQREPARGRERTGATGRRGDKGRRRGAQAHRPVLRGISASQGYVPGIEPTDHILPKKEPGAEAGGGGRGGAPRAPPPPPP